MDSKNYCTNVHVPASLCCGPQARHIYPSLVLVQPRKTRPCLTERLLMGRKESNQTNKQKHVPVHVFLSLKTNFVLANSADPDEMPHGAAFHLGLHGLPKYLFYVSGPGITMPP